MDAKHLELIRKGVDEYLSHYDDPDLSPLDSYLSFDFEEVDAKAWTTVGASLVKGELQGMTNIMNGWLSSLLRWEAWNRALTKFDEEDAWDLRIEFVEACAHQCLLQPSAVRDALIFIAINSMHQVKLSLGNGYSDTLPGDPKASGGKQSFPSRKMKEECLEKLTDGLPAANAFFASLRSVDDASYRTSTYDYRNRTSHAIGPRLGIGITQFVSRSVVPATELEKQPDGTFQMVDIPGKVRAQYAIGGTPPIDMRLARSENAEQFRRARECFVHYREMLREAMALLPKST